MRLMPLLGLFLATLATQPVAAAEPATTQQSTITVADGSACRGDDRTRKQTELAARDDAKTRAAQQVLTHVRSEVSSSISEDKTGGRSRVAQSGRNLMEAYAHARVRELADLEKGWDAANECYSIKLKCEVTPEAPARGRAGLGDDDSPVAPLQVKIWTDKPAYAGGEVVRLFIKGNKPFHAKVVYRAADGSLVQLLPNPYRRRSHFEGGVLYELPGNEDAYTLEVSPPFGAERITLYASQKPLGELRAEATGPVYKVLTEGGEVAAAARNVAASSGDAPVVEFAEAVAEITTSAGGKSARR